jgi:fibronectin-binding autotransporter adhesin
LNDLFQRLDLVVKIKLNSKTKHKNMKTALNKTQLFQSRTLAAFVATLVALLLACPNAGALNGTAYYLDLNGTASGFGTPVNNSTYTLPYTVAITLSTGFSSGATVTSVVVSSATGIAAGQVFTGTGVPAGVTVSSISGTTINVSSFTATANSSSYYFFNGASTTLSTPFSSGANVTSLAVSSATGIGVGELVSGTGIPANSVVVTAVSGTTITVSSFTSTSASSGNYTFTPPWTTSSAGTATPGAFTSGGQMTFGASSSDLANSTFSVNVAGGFAGIAVNSGSATITLTGVGSSSQVTATPTTWTVAAGSTLIENVLNSSAGLNFNSKAITLNGGGTINFASTVAYNNPATTILEENMTGGVVNMQTNNMGPTTQQGSYKLTAGTLNFATASSANAFACTKSPNTNTLYLNGGTLDNTSGSGMTLSLGTGGGSYSIGGSFTFTGSSSLDLGNFPVALAATPTITVNNNTLTLSGIVSGSQGITKAGSGTLTLAGANTYTAATTISGGTLSVASVNSVSTPTQAANSSLGVPSSSANGTISIGSTTTAGQLTYTGTSGETSDRVINLAGTTGGATLDQSGTAALKFTSALTATGVGAKTLILQGSTAGTGELGGAIVDSSSGATAVTKAGSGTWTLSGANGYTGNTTVSAGTLALGASGSLNANSSVSIAAGATFNVAAKTGSSGTYTWGGSASLTAVGGTSVATAAQITAGASATVDVSGRPVSLTFTPASTSGDSTHPALNISAGSLALNSSTTFTINNNGSALNAGDYTLISGTVTGTPTASPVIVGGTGGLVSGGVATLNASSGTLVLHVVTVTATSLTLTRTAGSNPSTYGDALTFNAVVSPDPGNGSTITFYTNGTAFGTTTTTSGSGVITTSNLNYSGGGSWTVTATFAGNSSYASSTGTTNQQVNQKTLTIAGATAQNKRYDGNTTATVSGTLVGVTNNDSLTLVGNFVSAGPGSGISVTNYVTGAAAGNYYLTQPGVTASIFASPTWNGGSATDNNWSDAANWNGLSLLPANDTLVFDGSTRLNTTNDTTAGTTYSNITFNAGAGAFVLNGNPITLSGNVTNNSTNLETINLGLNFGTTGTNLTLNGGSGGLIIGNGLTNNLGAPGWTTLTLAGTGTLTNLLSSVNSPGGTNVLNLNSSSASWTIVDNSASAAITVPWAFYVGAGTLNFGAGSSAPVLTSTTPNAGTKLNGTAQDNFVGNVTGQTATLNFVNGTLTTAARWDTCQVLNSTGIIAQAGGTINIASQFQGANGSYAGENSAVTISGGTMNLYNGSLTTNSGTAFFVASRGTGSLTLAGTGQLNCGTLDVSRNGAGNTFGSVGVVNLNGGTLVAGRVGTATSGGQTSTANGTAATFNFNGGTLKANASSTNFFQGNTVAPVIPITTIVKSGGAIIDTDTNSVSFLEPLQHDATLGGTPDGGLTKLGTGVLVLGNTNTYTGNTVVSNGTLELVQLSLATNSTVTIGSTAVLQLDPTGTNQIAGLTINGVSKASGIYSAATDPTYLTGLGSLLVGSGTTGPTGPAQLTNSVSGGVLSLSWPSGQGWKLQMQTNSLSVGLGTNWVYVTDGSTTSTNIAIDPAKPTVFYRLAYP